MSNNIVPQQSSYNLASANNAQTQQQTQQLQSAEQSHAPKQNLVLQFLPILVIFLFFYLMIIRPQAKKSKETAKMISEIKIGTKILTTSGIYAIVTEIDKDGGLIKAEIAKNVRIVMTKSAILSILKNEDPNI